MKKVYFCIYILLAVSCQSTEHNSPSQSNNTALFELLIASTTGIEFTNEVVEVQNDNFWLYEYFYNGGGVAIGDINNDNLPDIYFTGNNVADKLYLNKGNLQFEDITVKAGIEDPYGWSSGVTMADVNADGHLDIYVSKAGKYKDASLRKNRLYLNNGDLTFTEQAAQFGLADEGYSVQAAFFDYDKDGDLDMYLTNHPFTFQMLLEEYYRIRNQFNPHYSDKLFQNQGDNTFKEVGEQAGIHNFGYGLGLSVGDLNGDNWPDLYIANDFEEHDFYYVNNQDGTFTESLKTYFPHTAFFGMGTDIADINNDGLLDIAVLDMAAEDYKRSKTMMRGMNPDKFHTNVNKGLHYQYMFNALHLNNGNGHFSEIAKLAGVAKTDWSWSVLAADFDNDSFNDLVVTNGYLFDVQDRDFRTFRNESGKDKGYFDIKDLNEFKKTKKLKSTRLPNYIFKNNGNLTFSKVSDEWGFNFKGFSNGLAYADLDRDGDLDLVTNNINDPAHIHKNLSSDKKIGNYLSIQLKGTQQNGAGIGAKVKIKITGNKLQVKEIYSTRGFQSASEATAHFGLKDNDFIEKIDITWPDGTQQSLQNIAANQLLNINKAIASQPFSTKQKTSHTVFQDISRQANVTYKHTEINANDFAREQLLPHKFSQAGPAVAVGDVNQDGLDDIYLGGATMQAGELHFQQANGQFVKQNQLDFTNHHFFEDVDAAFFDADNDGDLDLYVASGSNEAKKGALPLLDRLYLQLEDGQFRMPQNILPKIQTSTSCIKPNDYDKDGDIDLFVGGHIIAGKYPYAPRSYLLENKGGTFVEATPQKASELQHIGLVKDAIWADIDQDKDDDLIVVGEWMPIVIFENNKGKLTNATQKYQLQTSNGWWQSIVAKDIDQDGDLDLIAGNQGLNNKFTASLQKPFKVYAKDFDKNGTNDIVLAKYTKDQVLHPVRGLECSSEQMPFIKEKFKTFNAFADADLHEIIGKKQLNESLQLEAYTFATTYFENINNQHFKAHSLPNEAQLSPTNGILAQDFDGDQHIDLLLAGNFYHTEVETPRHDASIGTFLKGDGKGNFNPISLQKSGFFAPKDVRKLKAIPQIAHHKAAVLVTNNNNSIQIFSY